MKRDHCRFHRVQACCHAVCDLTSASELVDLEVRNGTSAKALNVVCWGTGLQIIRALWNGYTANAVLFEFKRSLFTGAAGVVSMLVDSQSPWQNGKTGTAGQYFKHQLWDMHEDCHIEGNMECKAAVVTRWVFLRTNACLEQVCVCPAARRRSNKSTVVDCRSAHRLSTDQ